MRIASISVIAIMAVACGSSSKDDCAEDQVEVSYLGGPRDGETVCAARPATCGNPAKCTDPCTGDMYRLCGSPYSGVACSDTFAPPIISCNP